MGAAGILTTQLAVQNIITHIPVSRNGVQGGFIRHPNIVGDAGNRLHKGVELVGRGVAIADDLTTQGPAATGAGRGTGMDVDTTGAVGVAVLVAGRRIVAGIGHGVQGAVRTGMVDGLNGMDTVHQRGSTGVSSTGAVIGIIGDGRTVLAGKCDIGIAAGVLLHHDDHRLGTDIVGSVLIGIGRIIIRAAFEHENDILSVVQSGSELAEIVQVVLHHGIDVSTVPAVGDKAGAGQIIDAAHSLCLHRSKCRYHAQQQTQSQHKGQNTLSGCFLHNILRSSHKRSEKPYFSGIVKQLYNRRPKISSIYW